MLIKEPQDLETYLLPMLGDIKVTQKAHKRFYTDIESFYGFSSGMISFKASAMQIDSPPQPKTYTFTIPIASDVKVRSGKFDTIIPTRSMFLRTPYEHLTMYSERPWHSIVCKIDARDLEDSLDQIFRMEQLKSDIVCTSCHQSNILYRAILKAWSEANKNKLPGRIDTNKEIEIELLSAFSEWLDSHEPKKKALTMPKYYYRYAKEYLDSKLKQEISKEELEEVTGMSIRSITREFKRHTGMGPMAYLKQRRIDAAYLDLLNARPEESKVSDIALEYRLNHLGKFASEYKKVFRESPSNTLSTLL